MSCRPLFIGVQRLALQAISTVAHSMCLLRFVPLASLKARARVGIGLRGNAAAPVGTMCSVCPTRRSRPTPASVASAVGSLFHALCPGAVHRCGRVRSFNRWAHLRINMLLGRLLVSFALLSTLIGPVTADWNHTHVFNPDWPPHARFHSIVGLCMTIGFSLIGLWLLWKKSSDSLALLFVAASVPVLAWATFFIAALVPGAGVEDHAGALPRILGLPLNLFVALIFSVISVAGYLLCFRAYRNKT